MPEPSPVRQWTMTCCECWDACVVDGQLSRPDAENQFRESGYRERTPGRWVCEGCYQEFKAAQEAECVGCGEAFTRSVGDRGACADCWEEEERP